MRLQASSPAGTAFQQPVDDVPGLPREPTVSCTPLWRTASPKPACTRLGCRLALILLRQPPGLIVGRRGRRIRK